MTTHYYVELDGQHYGPYELEQMRTFGLLPNIKVYSTETEEWYPVESYPELVDFVVNTNLINKDIDIYNSVYYLKLEEVNYGPYSLPELSFLDIDSNSLLSVDNMDSWQYASEIKGLLQAIDFLVKEEEQKEISTVNTPSEEELKNI